MSGTEATAQTRRKGAWRAFLWPTWEQRKKVVYAQAWLAVVAAYLLYISAWLMPQDFDDASGPVVAVRWFFFMVEVMTEHVGWMLLVMALVAGMRRLRLLAGVAGLMAAILLGPTILAYVPKSGPGSVEGRFRVMSINLLCINRETEAIVGEIRATDPDVILIQEYAPHWHEAFRSELLDEYPHHIGFPQDDSFGAAIYSRFPFREEPRLLMSMGGGDTPQIRAVVEVGKTDVAFYNIHLLPPRYFDYVIARDTQFAALLKSLEDETLPVVLSGDFNFPGTSPHARRLADKGMTDAHDAAGYGRRATWPVNGVMRYLPLPGIRIDHVYFSSQLTCTRAETGDGFGSDHRPVIADLGFSGGGGP